MPRSARKQSSTGIYHVMLRGINQQDIFKDEEDYLRFLSVVKECKEVCGFELYAYCLMTNHVHLLIKVGKEPLELIFKRIGCRYVKQGTVLRFILQHGILWLLTSLSGMQSDRRTAFSL